METEALLEELVEMLNIYNKEDMLDGYLNSLGQMFNERLSRLGISKIKEVY